MRFRRGKGSVDLSWEIMPCGGICLDDNSVEANKAYDCNSVHIGPTWAGLTSHNRPDVTQQA